MPSYRYEVKTAGGQLQSGVLNAASMSAASEILRGQQSYIMALAPMDASRAKSSFSSLLNFSVSSGPGLKDVSNFTNQLAVMIKAGISIRAALEAIADQTENPKFKAILTQIKKDVESGKSFSDALQKYPKTFSPLYINMVKASELSGSFGQMLERIVEYLNAQLETRQMVVGAMVYPAIIFVMAIGTTVFLLLFVVPQFVAIFKGKESILPLPTKVLLVLSAFMKGYWYLILLGLGAGAWSFYTMIQTQWGRLWWDKTKLTVPLFKKMFRALYITRSLHTMGELVNAGVPMLDTLAITADSA
jgi:type II secretory pathway component PulF